MQAGLSRPCVPRYSCVTACMPYIQNSAFDSLKGVRRKTLAMLFFEQPP